MKVEEQPALHPVTPFAQGLPPFAILAYAITWLLLAPWFYAFTVVYRGEPPAWLWWLAPLAFIGGWGPTAAAILITARQGGRAAVRHLLASLLVWRVGVRWYLLVFFLPPLLAALALVIAERGIGPLAEFNVAAALANVPIAYAVALPFGPLGEELGWRGFALPRLLASSSAVRATLVLGALWTFWHVPMMLWFPGASMPSFMPLSLASVLIYLAQLLGISAVMTLVWLRTRGSVFLAVLAHMTFNTAESVISGGLPALPRPVVRDAYLVDVCLLVAAGALCLALASRDRVTPTGRGPGS